MSQENVEIVRAVYKRWSEGDLRASVDCSTRRFSRWCLRGSVRTSLEGGTYLGTEAIAAYTREFLLETWANLTMEADEIEVGRRMRTRERARVRRGTHQRCTDRDALTSSFGRFAACKVIRFEKLSPLLPRSPRSRRGAGVARYCAGDVAGESPRGDHPGGFRRLQPRRLQAVDRRPVTRTSCSSTLKRLQTLVSFAATTGYGHGSPSCRRLRGEGFRFEPISITQGDGVVVVDTRASGVGVGGGVPIEMTVYMVLRFRDQKVVWTKSFMDRSEALEAAGLSE